MSALGTSPPDPRPRHPGTTVAPPSRTGTAAALVLLVLLCAAVWSVGELRLNVATLVDSVGNAADFLSRTLPLDFPPLGELVALTGQTIAIVVCATLLSVLVSVPIAVLAAGNTTPALAARYGARTVIVVARAVPDVVLAIVFFRLFGLGALAGVLAMGLHSVGMVGKLYADAIEQIDEGPRTAVRATGARPLQELVAGVLPQVLPAFVATALHRFDINLRISVLLGFVGVGGLGFEIANALRRLDYQRGVALALVVLGLCVAAELVSGAVRRALLGGHGERAHRRGGAARAVGRRVDALRAHPLPGPGRAVPDAGRVTPPWTPHRVRGALFGGVTALVVIASVAGADLSPWRIITGLPDMITTLALFWPPTTGGILSVLLAELAVTVQIALAATLLGAMVALPVGALAARNVSPTPETAAVFRMVIVVVRGVPELVLAIVFVVITGLGPVAGALALAIGATGLLGKLVADSLEETDVRVQQAVRASGASRSQVFVAVTLPQAAPAIAAHLLYQLDVNIRSATLLGIVGAGGIGFYLLNASRVMEFGVVTTITSMVFATVMAVELLTLWLRRAVS
ncbi:phosphonate ABC transporter, permease protein PhnE [Pseudonocardia alaniniphila]|uniref:Phosphonate ABC transporter, permease protein PhnE n=1 Tax=Pseudonocardia alaniniphila TaxID=75291 RepID=A0ABS9TMZ0_9PSEU|nr:phosphonate ABC transporter, permease protein PhnE [Pseudonocardia alaniniphila]MCH6169904.1 phosphonate ABC transporter, permease protein PhnE [Pseudonocardia alaniniphila]